MTISISLPRAMLIDVRKAVKAQGHASVSEFMRGALCQLLYGSPILIGGHKKVYGKKK